MLAKTLPVFGELFPILSYQEIGFRTMVEVCQGKIIFSWPGSSGAVKLAMEKFILPELVHLVKQLRN